MNIKVVNVSMVDMLGYGEMGGMNLEGTLKE